MRLLKNLEASYYDILYDSSILCFCEISNNLYLITSATPTIFMLIIKKLLLCHFTIDNNSRF